MGRIFSATVKSAPPIFGGAVMLMGTVDFSAATSTVSKNLKLFGVNAPPEWLLAKAADGWVFGVGFGIVALWGFGLWWSTREGKTDRQYYVENLQQMLVSHTAMTQRMTSVPSDADFDALLPDYQTLALRSIAFLRDEMGEPAVAKFVSGVTSLGFTGWEGEHSAEARSHRDRLLRQLYLRTLAIDDLLARSDWDHPVPLAKRQRKQKWAQRRQWIWNMTIGRLPASTPS